MAVLGFIGIWNDDPFVMYVSHSASNNQMHIAQVAPLIETVPPECYGGTERIVSYLTEELIRLGHEVTLFASGGSTTTANLIEVSDASVRSDPSASPILRNVIELEEVLKRAEEFDLIHFHDGFLHFPLVRRLQISTINTTHRRMDLPDPDTYLRGVRGYASGLDFK